MNIFYTTCQIIENNIIQFVYNMSTYPTKHVNIDWTAQCIFTACQYSLDISIYPTQHVNLAWASQYVLHNMSVQPGHLNISFTTCQYSPEISIYTTQHDYIAWTSQYILHNLSIQPGHLKISFTTCKYSLDISIYPAHFNISYTTCQDSLDISIYHSQHVNLAWTFQCIIHNMPFYFGPSVDDQAVSLSDDGTTIIIDFLSLFFFSLFFLPPFNSSHSPLAF